MNAINSAGLNGLVRYMSGPFGPGGGRPSGLEDRPVIQDDGYVTQAGFPANRLKQFVAVYAGHYTSMPGIIRSTMSRAGR